MQKEGKIVVANTGEDSLSIIDIKNNYKIETVSFSSCVKKDENINLFLDSFYIGPYDICTNDKLDKIYCVNSYNNSIFKIDIHSNIVEDLVVVGSCPNCLKLYDDLIITSNADSNSISIVDEKSFKLLESIPVGDKPSDIEINKKTGKIFVANSNDCSIEIVDLNKNNTDKIVLSSNPIKLEIDENLLYVLSNKNNEIYNLGNISIIELDHYGIVKNMNFKGTFNDMVRLKEKNLFFLTNIETGFLYEIDIKKGRIVDKIFLGGMPNRIICDINNVLYLTNMNKNMVSIIKYKTEKIVKNIEVGLEPNGLIIV